MPDHDLPRANWDDDMRSPAGQDRPWPGLSADEKSESLNSDLLSFRPPLDVQRDVVLHDGANAEFHRIEDGHGPVNLDFYPVHIERLPSLNGREMTPEDFVDYARRTLDDFLDDDVAKFSFYDKESLEKWASDDPLGAIMRFDIRPAGWNLNAGIEGGSVALTAQTPLSWTFSTVRTDEDHGHPVSGNREWGLAPQEDGSYVFYARGADRPTGVVDSLVFVEVFEGADDLWTGMQARVADWVNEHGGSATVMPRTWERHSWDSVEEDFFTPVTPWLDREDFLATLELPPDECTAESAQPGIDPNDAVEEEFCPLEKPQAEQPPDPALVEDVAPLECVVSPPEEEHPSLEPRVPPVPSGAFDSPVELPDWLTPTLPSGGSTVAAASGDQGDDEACYPVAGDGSGQPDPDAAQDEAYPLPEPEEAPACEGDPDGE